MFHDIILTCHCHIYNICLYHLLISQLCIILIYHVYISYLYIIYLASISLYIDFDIQLYFIKMICFPNINLPKLLKNLSKIEKKKKKKQFSAFNTQIPLTNPFTTNLPENFRCHFCCTIAHAWWNFPWMTSCRCSRRIFQPPISGMGST